MIGECLLEIEIYLPKQVCVAEAVTDLRSGFNPVKNDTPTDLYPENRPRTVLKRFAHRETALENSLSLVGTLSKLAIKLTCD